MDVDSIDMKILRI